MRKQIAYLIILIGLIGCSTTPKQLNLTEKGVIVTKIKLIDFDQHRIMKPIKVFFAKLNSPTDFKSKEIFASDEKNEDGSVYINLAPGTYAVIAADRYISTTLVRTVLEDEAIKNSVVELNIGETKYINLRILDYSKTVFDDMSPNLKYYHKVLSPKMVDFFEFKIGKYFPVKNDKKNTNKNNDEDNDEKINIQNY